MRLQLFEQTPDPAAALIGAIHRPKVKHHKPLSRQDITDLAKGLDEFGGYRTTVIKLFV